MTLIRNAYGGSASFIPNYQCPKCGTKLKFNKPPSMFICNGCKAVIDGEDLIKL